MANTNAPFGLRLLQRQNDATPSFGLGMDPLKIAAANTTKIAKGDILLQLTTGYVTAAVAALSTTGRDQAVGIFWGCQYLSISQGKRVVSPYWPGADATGDVDVSYIPLGGFPNARFVCQTLLTSLAFEDIGENIDIAYAAPTVFGSWARSNVTLAQATLGTTATLPFRVTGLWSQYQTKNGIGTLPGTDNASSYNWAVVEFNGNNALGSA